jgi:hypothetical protein
MRKLKTVLFLVALLGLSLSALAQTPTPACTSPEYRAFDFWVGAWNVYAPNGKLVGKYVLK